MWFMFESLIHFEFIIVSDVRQGFTFILLHVDVQFSQHRSGKILSFAHHVFLVSMSAIR